VLVAPKHAPSLAASGAKKPRLGFFGDLRRLAPENLPQLTETASGCEVSADKTVSGRSHWKVYGPDLNGVYGGMQGTGGLEATIMNGTGVATGVINDYFGNGVATISGGSVTWNPTKVGGYGPLPDSAAQPLTSVAQLASAVAWRGHYIDPTGFYNLGARVYEPVSGRFLSCDPLSFAAGTSLYAFGNGDPVNHFDPDGRCPLDGGPLSYTNPNPQVDFNTSTGGITINVGPNGTNNQDQNNPSNYYLSYDPSKPDYIYYDNGGADSSAGEPGHGALIVDIDGQWTRLDYAAQNRTVSGVLDGPATFNLNQVPEPVPGTNVFQIPATPDQQNAIIGAAEAMQQVGPPDYALLTNNCATVSRQFLVGAGMLPPLNGDLVTPQSLGQEIWLNLPVTSKNY
jgi:RHS repeat-associated protein